jgi:hypothetical protein
MWVVLAAVSWMGMAACGNNTADSRGTIMPRIVPHAAGATRLLASPKGAFAVAELRGPWQTEEFQDGDNVPGVLKVLDGARSVRAAIMGWPLGAPDDPGTLVYVEEAPHEYRYRVASTGGGEPVALTPPDSGAYWHVKAAVGDPGTGCAAIVLWSPVSGHDWNDPAARLDRLWLASVDRNTLAVRASREIGLTTPLPGRGRYGRGVAAGAGVIALIEVPAPEAADATYRVHALDCATLETRWTAAVAVPEPAAEAGAGDRGGTEGRITSTVATAQVSARDERALATADLAFSGSGKWLAMIHGARRQDVISAPRIVVLDAATGAVAGLVGDRIQYDVSAAVPLGTGDGIALNHLTSFRVAGGPSRQPAYYGVTAADLAARKAALVMDAGRLRVDGWSDANTVRASAIAAPLAAIELAPDTFAWVAAHDRSGGAWPQGSDAIGAGRPEVFEWMTLPRDWHRPARDPVKAHDAWMESTRRP